MYMGINLKWTIRTYRWSGSNFVSKGATRHQQKFLPTWPSKKIQYKIHEKIDSEVFWLHECCLVPSGPPLWCMPEKFRYNPSTHFFTSGQHYPLQPSKIPCEFFVHSHLLALGLASNYPNVNPKCQLQAWWSNEWFLFQHNTGKLLKCELLLMLVAKLQQRNRNILPLISTLLSVHLSSLSLSLTLHKPFITNPVIR
jgi:hypothetical protein